MIALLHTDMDWSFELEFEGTYIFERDITVHLVIEGFYGSSEILGWQIESISIDGRDPITKRKTIHYLPDDSEAAKLIVNSLNSDKSFDRAVREHALAQAREAA
jgi:hypothetical protein